MPLPYAGMAQLRRFRRYSSSSDLDGEVFWARRYFYHFPLAGEKERKGKEERKRETAGRGPIKGLEIGGAVARRSDTSGIAFRKFIRHVGEREREVCSRALPTRIALIPPNVIRTPRSSTSWRTFVHF